MASYVSYETKRPAAYEIRMEHELRMRQEWIDGYPNIGRRPFEPFKDKEGSDDRVQAAGA